MSEPAQGRPRILVLGETRDALALRRALGVLALRRADGGVAAVLDAHHPFDFEGPAAAAALAQRLGAPICRLIRPGWRPSPQDRWRRVPTDRAAFRALAPHWRRVFVTLGRDRLSSAGADSDRLYVLRVKDVIGRPPTRLAGPRWIAVAPGQGPFTAEGEARLFARWRIDALVTRDDGGPDAFPKLAAARRMGLPVVMVGRPPLRVASPDPHAFVTDRTAQALQFALRRLATCG